MLKRVVVGLSTLATLGGMVAVNTPLARADVAPPDGIKYVSYEMRVQGLEAYPDHVLLVYPWSLSNGAPTREVGVIDPGKPLNFGRRISGPPKVYAMRREAWENVRAEVEARDPEAGGGDDDGFPAPGAIDCGLTVSPVHQVDEDGPDVATGTYEVAALSDDGCRLQKLSSTPSPQARGGCASCTVGSSGDDRPWWLVGLLALALRRRR